MKKTHKTDKTMVTTRSCYQWKLVVNSLLWQRRLSDCYLMTITSSHPSKIAVKYQQKLHEYYLMDNHAREVHVTRSTHDRKRMWQEMHQRNTNWSSEEGNPKHKQAQESSRSQLSEPITTNISKKQPIKHLERRSVNKTHSECSAINTDAFGQKVGRFNKTLCRITKGLRQLTLSVVLSRTTTAFEKVACPG